MSLYSHLHRAEHYGFLFFFFFLTPGPPAESTINRTAARRMPSVQLRAPLTATQPHFQQTAASAQVHMA